MAQFVRGIVMTVVLACGIPGSVADTFETVVSFGGAGSVNPGAPSTPLIEGSDGMLYGMTSRSNGTTVFRVNKSGTGFVALRELTADEGSSPMAKLTETPGGKLFGTLQGGGTNGGGTIFKINMDGSDFAVLVHFGNSKSPEGSLPTAPLTLGSDGNIYGTTLYGGTNDDGFWSPGTFFRLKSDGTSHQVLFSFSQGEEPFSGLVESPPGYYLGTTAHGGYSLGTIYRIRADGQEFSVLHAFGLGSEGGEPWAGVIVGSDGRLYGTTDDFSQTSTRGSIYSLNSDGTDFRVLRYLRRTGEDGLFARGGVVEGLDGALYGSALAGGEANRGVIFRLNKDGSRFMVLRSLGISDLDPWGSSASLLRTDDGYFYGTTTRGGDSDFGAIFRLPQPPSIISIDTSGLGVQLLLSGLPGRDYSIEATTDLHSTAWGQLGIGTAGTNGLFVFDDLDFVGRSLRCYRTVAR